MDNPVKMLNEHQKQMVQYLTSAKQQADEELSSSRRELAAATTRLAEHQAAYADLRRSADLDRIELQKKEESLASLQKDMKQLLHEFNMQAGDMKNTILKQDKELKEATESNEALKKALCNQEAFTKSVCEQNNQLQEKISALEDQNCAASNALKDLDNKLQESITANDDYKNTIALLQQSKEELEKAIRDKDESLNNTEIELENLKQQLCIKDAEHAEVVKELNVTKDECSEKMAKVHDFKKLVGELENNVCELKKEMEEIRSSTAQQIQDLNTTVEEKEKELSSKASTIAQLMTELKTAGDARSRVEAQLARSKSEAAGERAAAMARETASRTQIDQLEVSVRNKDDELSKQMSIILEIRSEKERLQDKIQSMQNTIDNIQKELTGRVLPNGNRQPPDHDDNALMCPPSKELSQSPKLPTNFAVPRSEPKQLDSMLFSLFSDGSMDGDTLDQSEVNRRFEALSRGERVPPLALGALKRRAGLKYRPQRSEDVSLSQIKEDLKAKEKMFFKSKRSDPKNKRMK